MVKPNLWNGRFTKPSRTINRIVVHTQAGYGGVKSIESARIANGWKTGGYHIYIEIDGTIHLLYSLEAITNGVKGYNKDSIHICYEGGINKRTGKGEDTRTDNQKSALLTVLKELRKVLPNQPIVGHRDLSPDLNGNGIIEPFEWVKLCPCFDAIPEYKNI